MTLNIEAQEYAKRFYEKVGFRLSSDTFMGSASIWVVIPVPFQPTVNHLSP